MSNFATIQGASKQSGVAEATIYRYAKEGKIKLAKVGNQYIVPLGEISKITKLCAEGKAKRGANAKKVGASAWTTHLTNKFAAIEQRLERIELAILDQQTQPDPQ